MAIIDVYKPNAWKTAKDSLADHMKMDGPFQNGLLHLIYYLLYTEEGRKFMHNLIPGQPPIDGGDANTDAFVRTELKKKFTSFRVDPSVHEALIGAHFAGFAWIAAHSKVGGADIPERDKQEAIYKQNIAGVSWFLWEQGSEEVFPLGW